MTTKHGQIDAHDRATSLARQILYRFVAHTLKDPQNGSWIKLKEFEDDLLIHEAAFFLRSHVRLDDASLAPGERPSSELCVKTLFEHLPSSTAEMNSIYEQTFGLLVSSPCPPYESEYIDSKFVFQRSNALADLNGFYAAFGLKVADDRPERSDHIVLELEFMAHLIRLERAAAEIDISECVERQRVCHDAQARFLREHLVWWVPAFSKLLRRIDPVGFYGAVGTFLGALIAFERTAFELPAPSRGAAPSEIEMSEMCDSCQIGV
jgi:TorA maturation chaperone TorD